MRSCMRPWLAVPLVIAWYVTGTSDPRWEGALVQLRAHPVYGHDFEVLKLGPITSC